MQHAGRRRGRAAQSVDAWDLWAPETDPATSDSQGVTGICARVAELVSAALWAEDAGDAWARASRLLEDPEEAIESLGAESSDPVARHSLVQRIGGVGALVVVACEELSPQPKDKDPSAIKNRSVGASDELLALLRRLLVGLTSMSAKELDDLMAAIETADGFDPQQELARDRRWLNVTYAVAARDGTDEAHHLYLDALDRVLASTRPLVTS